jgi:serine/threonine protein kinase
VTDPDRHRLVYELFLQARGLSSEKRRILLDEKCAGDLELRTEVELLLDVSNDHGEVQENESNDAPDLQTRTLGSVDPLPDLSDAASSTSGEVVPAIPGFEILKSLHRGGQGVVYQAIQKATKRKVAIKILREGPYASKTALKRFEREVELVAQLKHPNIISIFDSGTTPDGWRFFVMDYIRGLPLTDHVRDNRLPLEDTLTLFAQVCDAIQYAHYKGIIHRDLKPSNILVTSEGVPKVLDFGLARQFTATVDTVISLTQEVVGTLPYMSPEQAKGNPDHIDTRTDLYALGVILYELLTGQYPYPVAGHMAEVLNHISSTPPTPPHLKWSPEQGIAGRSSRYHRSNQCPIDDELQTVILKTLSKERDRRYKSVGDLEEELQRYLRGDSIEAKRDSGWYVFKKAIKRHRNKLASAAGVAVLAGGLGFALLSERRRHEAERYVDDGVTMVHARARWVEAGRSFEKALELDPTNPKTLQGMAWFKKEYHCRIKPYAYDDPTLLLEAHALCAKAIELGSDSASVWNQRAATAMLTGQLQEAEEACRESLRVDPQYRPAWRYLAMVLALQHRHAEALGVLDKVQAIPTKDGEGSTYADEAWRMRGTLLLSLSKDGALASLEKAIEDKVDFRNKLVLARLYLTLDDHVDPEKALDLAEVAEEHTRLEDPRFARILAQAYLRNGRYEEAERYAERACSDGDIAAYCQMIKAIAQANSGDAESAKKAVAAANDQWPEFSTSDGFLVFVKRDFLWIDKLEELEALKKEAEQVIAAAEGG